MDEQGSISEVAFAELYELYQPVIRSQIYKMVGNRADADDLTQETFLKAYRALPQGHAAAGTLPWLRRIATNSCRDLYRRRSLRQAVSLDGLQEASGWEPEAPGNADGDYGVTAQLEMRRVLAALPPSYRRALLLHEYEGLSYRQIADIMGVPMTTVKGLLHRAHVALRRQSQMGA